MCNSTLACEDAQSPLSQLYQGGTTMNSSTSSTTSLPSFSASTSKSGSISFALPPASQSSTLGASHSAGAVSKVMSGLSSSTNPSLGAASAPTLSTTQVSTAVATSSAPPKLAFGATSAVSSTTATVAAASGTVASGATEPKMTYKELEEHMNKWSMELDHQEKVFLEQATKVNAWDKVLIENGQKITDLNSDVEKIKLDQHRLTNELDFIVAQQTELEEMLIPLEDSVAKLPPINYQQHTDSEREHTYQIAENIDAQLKRMTEDLKEVIDHLNMGTGSQDTSDPMLQISKILNAHMESLQWVDQNAALLQQKTSGVMRYAESTRKEHERNFRLAYN
ncbi:nuclear pore glycoprotein p62-like [Watersipora subatra]|uniref:nuclear pore glycoprotein p62-like n=1 Tax=Watersipora subatra TaxID=2589382 RepID=UPI00355BF92C